jgi:hypothetical protein
MMRALLLLLLTSSLIGCAHRVDAVFVELEDPDFQKITKSNVAAVVIANVVGYPDQNGKPYPPKFADAVRFIKDVPEKTAIYVGLVYVDNFNAHQADETYLRKAAKEDGEVARAFLEYLSKNGVTRPIAGWYLAREIHNFDDAGQQTLIGMYLKDAASNLPSGDVLIAPFFDTGCKESKTLNAERTAEMFAQLVRGTRITHLLLQDGFTGRFDHKCDPGTWDQYAIVAEQYEEKVAAAMKNVNVTFWVDLELEGEEATSPRIKRQYKILPRGTPVVAYKFQDCREKDVNPMKCPRK